MLFRNFITILQTEIMARIYTSKNFSKFCYNYFPTCEARITNPKDDITDEYTNYFTKVEFSTHWHAILSSCLAHSVP